MAPIDVPEAIKWWRKAAELGDSGSMEALATIYYDGPDELRDLSEIYFLHGCGQRAIYDYEACDLVAEELSPDALIAARERAAKIWSATPMPESETECSR